MADAVKEEQPVEVKEEKEKEFSGIVFASSLPRPSRINEKTKHPVHWPNLNEEHRFVRPLPDTAGEFMVMKNACKEFGINVVGVSRVENSGHAKKYYNKMDGMKVDDKDFPANEAYLFHGTPMNTLLNILKEGLDMRHSGSMNHFGKNGIYFSDNPRKAASYVKSRASTGELLVCRVMLGRTKVYPDGEFNSKLIKEPSGFHSVTGRPRHHAEFVVYENQRALVEYIVEYDNKKLLERAKRRKAARLDNEKLEREALDPADAAAAAVAAANEAEEATTRTPEFDKNEDDFAGSGSDFSSEEEEEEDAGNTDNKTKASETKIAKLRKRYLHQVVELFKLAPFTIQQQAVLFTKFEETYGPKQPEPVTPAATPAAEVAVEQN